MLTYNLKRDCKVYLVKDDLRWKIEVYPDLSFSQTFEELATNVKTLHDQNAVFEDATINKANPANFNLTVLLVKGQDFDIVGDWLTTVTNDALLNTYDIYIDSGVDIFKLEKGIAERATIQISKDQLVTINVSGTASKLTRYTEGGVPGILQSRDIIHSPVVPRMLEIELDGVPLTHISGATIELANEVQWLEYSTLHSSLYVTSASDSQSPEAFVVSKKVLSGTIQQYLTSTNNSRVNTWSTNSTLRIRLRDSSGDCFLDVDMPKVVFTNRLSSDDVFLQYYDFRLIHNPDQVYEILKYKELP